MKKILAFGLLALLLGAPSLRASSTFANVSVTTGSGGALLSQGYSFAMPPVTYTAKSTIHAVVVTKVILSLVNTSAAATWSLWDCPQGLTYSAYARCVVCNVNVAATAGSQSYDFTTGASNRTDDDGLHFSYYPVWVDNGTNTIDATVLYRPWTAPTVSGAASGANAGTP